MKATSTANIINILGKKLRIGVPVVALFVVLSLTVSNYSEYPVAIFEPNFPELHLFDIHEADATYAIFYNGFVNPESIYHSLGIIAEQLAQWQKSRYANTTLYYVHLGDTSVSFPCPFNGRCKLLIANSTGGEQDTLAKLYEYCQDYPYHNVVYLHSKGTYHSSAENNRLRNLLTVSALSEECFEGLRSGKCNICSGRFSPLPHWHTPGNMWTAKCSYIKTLNPIVSFEAKVAEIVERYFKDCPNCWPDWSVGTGRFSNEHWVHTHPQVLPCDVFPDTTYMYGYDVPEVVEPRLSLEKAPRTFQNIVDYQFMQPTPSPQIKLNYRLYELQQLYNATPVNNSFVWTWYHKANLV